MSIRQIKILMIDDDDIDILSTARLLQKCHRYQFSFLSALGGIKGLELLEEMARNNIGLPEIVLLDVNMPLLDGLETLQEIRSSMALRHLRVIMFSSPYYEEEILRKKDIKIDGFLEKPVNVVKLEDYIDKLAI